ncbi:MAG TPA: twin-arginine translocase TatA/TatE family subunit [Fimbriimonadaceae bacterium]|nr:twin-arginine translocase TatA/TatE family subunit [Fimbriimonadaceae bacterium]
MGALQPWHLILLFLVVVLLFGSQKIPELMRGVGRGMGEFKKGVEEGKKTLDDDSAVKKEEETAKK